jgi:hypothetical protein
MNIIVTTTINAPTKAVKLYDQMADWTLLVIGDQKTPKDYTLENGVYVSPQEQEARFPKLSELLGWNAIHRRNLGFLWAMDFNPEIVAVIDDDNIPLPGWGENLDWNPTVTEYQCNLPCFDPVGATNYPHLWHRDFPIQWLTKRRYDEFTQKKVEVDILAHFWNGDPDIDAFCRMEHAPDCAFDDSCFPLASTAIAPFNSQNTFLKAEVLPNYFMFPDIGRMEDIWAAYHVQSLGHRVAFGKANVIQERNVHCLTKDLEAEFLGNLKSHKLLEDIASGTYNIENYISERSAKAFSEYRNCW